MAGCQSLGGNLLESESAKEEEGGGQQGQEKASKAGRKIRK